MKRTTQPTKPDRRRPLHRARRHAPALGLLALAVAAGGCTTLFRPREDDYGTKVDPERFRRIESFQLKPRETPPDAQPEDPAAMAARRFEGAEQVELTLEQVRAATLEHNLGVKVALVDPAIANENLRANEAEFESAFTLSGLYQKTDSPTSSELNSAQAEFGQIEPGVSIPLITGGTAGIGFPLTRSDSDNEFNTLNPAYTSDLRFSLSQPLLRNAGRRASTFGIRIASYQSQIVQAQTKLAVIQQLTAIDTAYWRLYQVRRLLDVRRQELELAQAQLGRAQRRTAAGVTAEIEVVRAQSGVSDRLDAIIIAQNAVLARQRELKRIANIPGLDVDSPALIIPGTPPDPVEYDFDPLALADAALDSRMEMLQIELQLAQDASTIDFRENQALPQLDFSAGYTINGLGGSMDESLEVLEENNFEDWNIGFQATLPLGNAAARAELRQAVLTRLQRLSTQQGQRQTIRQEVLDATDDIRAGWQRVLAARQSVILNTRTLDAEQRQFDVGLTTSTDVLDAAARLADAQSTEISAIIDYQISQINLAAASGTLLGASKVEWAPAEAPELDGPFFAPEAPEDAQ
jgi:outer membrane protein